MNEMNLKGLILSGGAGTRLRPLTHTSAKQLVPVANEPVIFYGIKALVSAGITDIGIIIAPETGDDIRDVVGSGELFGASITYIPQSAPRGLADAVLTAEEFIGNDPFVMYLGDNILKDGITEFVKDYKDMGPDSMILLTKVKNPSEYGVAELEGGRVVKLVEKPAEPKSDLALVGVYIFNETIFAASKKLEPSARGELEITEAIQGLIDGGFSVETRVVDGWWKDTGSVKEMLEANRLILDSIEEGVQGLVLNSQIEGRVLAEDGAVIENSTIRGPAIIGKNAVVKNSYVGPNTAIDSGVILENIEIEYSIVLEGSEIRDIDERIEASLIGKNVKVRKKTAPPKTISFVLGENSEIETI